MIVAKIDSDRIAEPDDVSRVGTEWEKGSIEALNWVDSVQWDKTSTRFRLKDDDGEIYYSGWLYDDPDCVMQQILLLWGMNDAGCTTIEVLDNETGEWKQEIS